MAGGSFSGNIDPDYISEGTERLRSEEAFRRRAVAGAKERKAAREAAAAETRKTSAAKARASKPKKVERVKL